MNQFRYSNQGMFPSFVHPYIDTGNMDKDSMSNGDVKRQLSAVKNSVGGNSLKSAVKNVIDLMVDSL